MTSQPQCFRCRDDGYCEGCFGRGFTTRRDVDVFGFDKEVECIECLGSGFCDCFAGQMRYDSEAYRRP